jgi:hypothetical protein
MGSPSESELASPQACVECNEVGWLLMAASIEALQNSPRSIAQARALQDANKELGPRADGARPDTEKLGWYVGLELAAAGKRRRRPNFASRLQKSKSKSKLPSSHFRRDVPGKCVYRCDQRDVCLAIPKGPRRTLVLANMAGPWVMGQGDDRDDFVSQLVLNL